jgi:hypothetical protein
LALLDRQDLLKYTPSILSVRRKMGAVGRINPLYSFGCSCFREFCLFTMLQVP